MAKLDTCASLLMGAFLAVSAIFVSGPTFSAECKRKTDGFYLHDANPTAPAKLAFSLQSMPLSLTGALGDPARGRKLLADRQKGDCLSCHKLAATGEIANHDAIGPALEGIGSRFSKPQLRQVVVEPKAYFPHTIMPSYYKTGGNGETPVLTAAEVEDLVAYLETLK